MPTQPPLTLILNGNEPYDLAPGDDDDVPGIAYVRSVRRAGLAVRIWVVPICCPGCGEPLKMVVEDGKKTFNCGVKDCHRVWELTTVTPPGATPILALVMRHL